jgi:hypothetical protein
MLFDPGHRILGLRRHDRDESNRPYIDCFDIRPVRQVIGRQNKAWNHVRERGPVEPADRSFRPDPQFGIQVPEVRTVADDAFEQAESQEALVGVPPLAVVDESRLRVVCRQLDRLPILRACGVDELAGGRIDRTALAAKSRGGFGFQHGPDVGRAGAHAGGVGDQIREDAMIAVKRRAAVVLRGCCQCGNVTRRIGDRCRLLFGFLAIDQDTADTSLTYLLEQRVHVL